MERERGQDAKTQNDADGWPIPETKTKIVEMKKAERKGVGLRFATKFSLLSRLMAISEYDKKRFTLTEFQSNTPGTPEVQKEPPRSAKRTPGSAKKNPEVQKTQKCKERNPPEAQNPRSTRLLAKKT